MEDKILRILYNTEYSSLEEKAKDIAELFEESREFLKMLVSLNYTAAQRSLKYATELQKQLKERK